MRGGFIYSLFSERPSTGTRIPGTYMIQVPGFRCPTVSRSPRCSRGNPRSLPALIMVLVREFESRRGEILSLFAKIKGSTTVAECLAWVSTAVRRKPTREERAEIFSRYIMQGTNRNGDGGEEPAM